MINIDKKLVAGLMLLAGAGSVSADITVNLPKGIGANPDEGYSFEYGYISDLVKSRQDRPQSARDNVKPVNGRFVIKTLPDGPAQYVLPISEREYVVLYSRPGDNFTVDIDSVSPLSYSVSGSPMMADIARLDSDAGRIMAEYRMMTGNGTATEEKISKLQEDYNRLFSDYIAANPRSEAVPFAVMHLEGDDFLKAYGEMTPEAANSPLKPFLDRQKEYVVAMQEAERRKLQLQSGNVDAPDFTFKTREGKDVSLSDFRGKWVVIDFWGSWCPWCIKGFPALKEAYAKYKPELEIIGVACSDPRDKWEAALKKYDLPWVNEYNPEEGGGRVVSDYAVEGFPTKVIVSPEGKIRNITSGENPAFFDILSELISKK